MLLYMNLILLQPTDVDADGRVALSDDRGKHIHKVLKAKIGQQIRVGLLNGPLGTGTVESVHATEVVLQCTFESEPPPKPRIDLLLAMPRPKVL